MDYIDEERKSRKSSAFKIDCVKLDFDGEVFGPVMETISILQFDEERKITELDVYPIQFDGNESMLRATLVKRGEHFATYRDFKHKKYAGLSLGHLEEEVRSQRMPSMLK